MPTILHFPPYEGSRWCALADYRYVAMPNQIAYTTLDRERHRSC